MTWKTLAESLESALASIANEVGDEVAGTRLDADKSSKRGPDAETPGQVRQEVVSRDTALRTQEDQVSRNMDRANPTRSPSAARSIFLVIEGGNGGGPTGAQGGVRSGRLRVSGEGTARELKLVVG